MFQSYYRRKPKLTILLVVEQYRKAEYALIGKTSLLLTISKTLRYPEENIIALGGVATGNMYAKEHESVAGTIKYHG